MDVMIKKIYILLIPVFLISAVQEIEAQYMFRNLGNLINSSQDEFLPYIYNDTLYFRKSRTVQGRRNNAGGVFDIYRIALKDISVPPAHAPELYNSPYPIIRYTNSNPGIDSKASRDGVISIDPSVPAFYNYSSDKITYMDDSKRMMGEISDDVANDMHPALSPDGNFIVFASDRARGRNLPESGLWDTDLYVSYRKADNTWTKPKNLGKEINTKENELSPFIAADGKAFLFLERIYQGFREDLLLRPGKAQC